MRHEQVQEMLDLAWKYRENAVAKKTKVGACVLAEGKGERMFPGCNIEHDYCRSFHAEEVAIMKAISNGIKKIEAIVIVAEIQNFTPCGACRDWIREFLLTEGLIAVQSSPSGPITCFSLSELFPAPPTKTKEPEKLMNETKQDLNIELGDTSLMPFGTYGPSSGKALVMQDVPASYLHYLWVNGLKNKAHLPATTNDVAVAHYIKKNLSALKKEHKDGIWE